MFTLNARWSKRILGAALLVLTPLLHAQDARVLQQMEFTPQATDGGVLTLSLSSPAPEPSAFAVEQPARISIDLPDTGIAMAERYRKLSGGNVKSITAVASGGRTRIVIELARSAPYQMSVDANTVRVQIDGPSGAAKSAGGTAAAPSASVASNAPPGSISNIDFRRGEQGEGRVVVSLSNPRSAVDVREDGSKIVAVFRNTAIPNALTRRLDVLDFATPVKFIDIASDGSDTRVTVTPSAGAKFDHSAYQAGDTYTIQLQPLTPEKVEEKRRLEPQYTGEKISLSFQSIDVRALLQIIADVAGTNMVVSDSVKGDIAMRLQNVPWDQALDIILKSKGLGMRQQGNVMMVAPIDELAQREKAELEAQKQKVELAPLRSEILQVNYAKASDIKALLGSDKTSLLTERGRVTVDERTNTLLVLETSDKIDEIRRLVARLDIPVRQVLIESRIVVANEDFARQIGTRFGVNSIGSAGSNRIGQSGTNTGSRDVIAGNTPTLDNSYIVNLPAASSAPSIAWTVLGTDFQIDLELQALQTEGRGEVISTPRVVTANGKQAMIEQGREIPYQTSSGNSGTNTQFKKAVLSLTVSPQITPDNRVIMDLNVTNDTQGANVQTGAGTAPAIDTRRVDTQVLIKSGETVVLGGVFQRETISGSGKVPLLGDIPLLGVLFRNSNRSDTKRELLIFVTPKVLQEGLTVN